MLSSTQDQSSSNQCPGLWGKKITLGVTWSSLLADPNILEVGCLSPTPLLQLSLRTDCVFIYERIMIGMEIEGHGQESALEYMANIYLIFPTASFSYPPHFSRPIATLYNLHFFCFTWIIVFCLHPL